MQPSKDSWERNNNFLFSFRSVVCQSFYLFIFLIREFYPLPILFSEVEGVKRTCSFPQSFNPPEYVFSPDMKYTAIPKLGLRFAEVQRLRLPRILQFCWVASSSLGDGDDYCRFPRPRSGAGLVHPGCGYVF
jgi:hypothetical protein